MLGTLLASDEYSFLTTYFTTAVVLFISPHLSRRGLVNLGVVLAAAVAAFAGAHQQGLRGFRELAGFFRQAPKY